MLVKLTRTERLDLRDLQDEIKSLNNSRVPASLSYCPRKKYYTVFWLPGENVFSISIYRNNKKLIFQKKITRSMSELVKLCKFD